MGLKVEGTWRSHERNQASQTPGSHPPRGSRCPAIDVTEAVLRAIAARQYQGGERARCLGHGRRRRAGCNGRPGLRMAGLVGRVRSTPRPLRPIRHGDAMTQSPLPGSTLPGSRPRTPPLPRRRPPRACRAPRRWVTVLLVLLVFFAGAGFGGGMTVAIAVHHIRHVLQHPDEAPGRIAKELRRKLGLDNEQTRQVGANPRPPPGRPPADPPRGPAAAGARVRFRPNGRQRRAHTEPGSQMEGHGAQLPHVLDAPRRRSRGSSGSG